MAQDVASGTEYKPMLSNERIRFVLGARLKTCNICSKALAFADNRYSDLTTLIDGGNINVSKAG